MTVSTTTNTVVYRGNGSATQFAVPFLVLDEDHLVVKRRVYATGELDGTYIGTDYSYSGIGDPAGTLTLAGTALSSTYELVIQRVVPYTQDLDIVNAGGFYPDTVETQLDLLEMQIQQIADKAQRSVRAAPGTDLNDVVLTPGSYLAVGGDGQIIMSSGTGTDAALRTDLASTGGMALVGGLLAKLGETVSVKDFGAVGDGVTDDTVAIQAAFTALAAGTIGGLYFPDGIYRITATITLAGNVLTGKHIYGQSIFNTVIRQDTDNTPIFSFTAVDLHHTWQWSTMMLTWLNDQTGNTNAACFRWTAKVGGAGKSFYQSSFDNIFMTNGYWFFRGDDIFWWGNSARNIFCNTKGGFAKLGGGTPGGQPRNIFEVYIYGGAAGVPLFEVPAMVAEYHVEVNDSDALMIADTSGGHHSIRRWDLEYCRYSADGTLFNCTNSIIHAYGLIRLDTITLTGTPHLTCFKAGPAAIPEGESYLEAASIRVEPASIASGAKLTVFGGNNTLSTVKRIRAPWTPPNDTTNGVMQLTDMGSADAANFITIEEWLDPARHLVAGDGSSSLTLDYDDPYTIIVGAVPLAADLVILLPRHDGVVGNNLFRGPRWKIVKLPNAGTTYKIDVKTYNSAVTVATIPAATASGTKEIRWDRTSLIGAGGVGHWTDIPVPV